jgi:diaminohydroxyphosphoribosylaminopyrimidine deaminase/5-amino-6-(5-phosphoribosylamino)uracil reductase
LRLLRRAGLSVASGVGAGEAAELLAPFARWVGSRRPFVTLKLALSLDGRIADAAGRSRWITGPAARGMVQALRRLSDAVMVGAATAAADNPSLLPVPPAGRRPYRVVVDGRGRLPAHARLLGDQAAGPTIVCTTRACPARRAASYRRRGATVWTLPARAGGRVSLRSLMRRLHGRGVLHVLCEGGGELAASLIRDGLVDRYVLFVAPRVIGGRKATPAVGGRGWAMGRTPGVRWLSVRRVGEDLMIVAVPEHRRAGRRRRVGE